MWGRNNMDQSQSTVQGFDSSFPQAPFPESRKDYQATLSPRREKDMHNMVTFICLWGYGEKTFSFRKSEGELIILLLGLLSQPYNHVPNCWIPSKDPKHHTSILVLSPTYLDICSGLTFTTQCLSLGFLPLTRPRPA